jgi:hypothetical protein
VAGWIESLFKKLVSARFVRAAQSPSSKRKMGCPDKPGTDECQID